MGEGTSSEVNSGEGTDCHTTLTGHITSTGRAVKGKDKAENRQQHTHILSKP